MTETIAHQGTRKAAEGPECLVCGDRHWTPYQVETLDGEQEEAWELCNDCCVIIPEKRQETREDRGIAHGEKHFKGIVKIRPWTWQVPKSSGVGFYEVNLKFASCTCLDRPPQGEVCKHAHSLRHARSIGTQCSGCRKPFRWRELIEVTEDHESLTWHQGDMLCFECGMATGVI